MDKIRANKFVRVLCKPYFSSKYKKIVNEYVESEYSEKMKKFKDAYKGKRCFVIGNGPSLTVSDLNKLKGEYTFGANRIYEIFDKTDWRPTFYIAVDGYFLKEKYEAILNMNLDQYFLEYKFIRDKFISDNVIPICRDSSFAINEFNDTYVHISEDLSKYYSCGHTVTFTSIQLAIYMGFKEIYLLGVDFSYSVVIDKNGKIHIDNSVKDYFNGKSYNSTHQNYSSTLLAYQKAEEYCRQHNIKLCNATRGGKLEVFDRVDFDSLF